jgi:two-component system NtrC family sensor kinase
MLFFFNIMLDLVGVLSNICVMADNNETSRSTTQIGLLKNEAETERLAAIGKFTAKIAHELNNPLDGILRYINLACRSVEANNQDKLNEYLNNSRQGILRMVKIVGELLEFSRCRYLPTEEPIPTEQIIEEAIKTCTGRSDTPPVQIVKNFAQDLPKLPAVNLFQVFCNLIKNAFDSMPDGGTLKISTKAESNGDITIEFRDTGHGFDPVNKDTLFEPFFTTKTQGKGTGLGLAICKDLVARHGGYITAANRAEGGSVFTVHLPKPVGAIV